MSDPEPAVAAETLTEADERETFCQDLGPHLTDAMESMGIEDADMSDGRALADTVYCLGYRQRADLTARLADNWRVFREHRPAGAYLPVGQLDGDCHSCGEAWPCAAVRDALTGGPESACRHGAREDACAACAACAACTGDCGTCPYALTEGAS